METNSIQWKELFTVKKVLRALSIVLLIFVFCPSFLVSCSGKDINVNVMTAVGGLSSYGEQVVAPHPIMLLCLVAPIVMLVVLFLKNLVNKKVAMITLGAAGVDFIMWIIFRAGVKKLAEENYCSFKSTAVYGFNMFVLVVILALTVLVVIGKLEMDSNLILLATGTGAQQIIKQVTDSASQMAGNVKARVGEAGDKEPVMGYCQKCGKGIPYGSKFCVSCGTPVPESLIAEAAKRQAEEQKAAEVVFCRHCGSQMAPGSAFCTSCGTKVE